MPSAPIRPSPAQLQLLVEADRGSKIILTENGCRWYKGRGNARTGKPRRATVLAAARMGWMGCEDEMRGLYGITEAGSEARAVALDAGMEDVPRSKLSMTVADLTRALEKRHPFPQWVLCPEVTIEGAQGLRYIDLLAVSFRWTVAYEFKVTREDFLKELSDPNKRREAMEVASQFSFCAPAGIIKVDELPVGAGLVEVFHNGNYNITQEGAGLERPPPDWSLAVRMLRSVVKAG